jgi:transcriptional repressor NrdR
VEVAITHVSHKLRALGTREVKSRKVGEWAMEELRKMDQVAYVRFASVYRSFEDVRAFLDEIQKLENELPPGIRENQLNLLNTDSDEN